MNTKIITALVIAFALVGLTGAASAAGGSYTGTINYDFSDIMDLGEPTDVHLNSGAGFHTVIQHFDTNYGCELLDNDAVGEGPCIPSPGGDVHVAGGVCNSMKAFPRFGMRTPGVTHQIATQGGSASVTIRSKDSLDGLPEVEAGITSGQSLWYGGSFDDYDIYTDDVGVAGAYGLLSNGLPDCGNIMLVSDSFGEGHTWTKGGSKLIEGTFSVATFEGMTADIEGVSKGDAIINVYGGAAGASTFVGAVDDGEGIETRIAVTDVLTVKTGWGAKFDIPGCPPHIDP